MGNKKFSWSATKEKSWASLERKSPRSAFFPPLWDWVVAWQFIPLHGNSVLLSKDYLKEKKIRLLFCIWHCLAKAPILGCLSPLSQVEILGKGDFGQLKVIMCQEFRGHWRWATGYLWYRQKMKIVKMSVCEDHLKFIFIKDAIRCDLITF